MRKFVVAVVILLSVWAIGNEMINSYNDVDGVSSDTNNGPVASAIGRFLGGDSK